MSEDGGGATKQRVDVKICGVCGDKALGYNFNAVTCESCKAFFRRNALKKKEFKCPFNDICKVDVVTRRFCQKCRLKRCLDIGMKREWIMTDDEKKVKKQKIEENRHKRQLVDANSPAGSSSVCSPLSSSDDFGGSGAGGGNAADKQSPQSPSYAPLPLVVTPKAGQQQQHHHHHHQHPSAPSVSSSSVVGGGGGGSQSYASGSPGDHLLLTPTSEERSPSDYDGSSLASPPPPPGPTLSGRRIDPLCSPSSSVSPASPASRRDCSPYSSSASDCVASPSSTTASLGGGGGNSGNVDSKPIPLLRLMSPAGMSTGSSVGSPMSPAAYHHHHYYHPSPGGSSSGGGGAGTTINGMLNVAIKSEFGTGSCSSVGSFGGAGGNSNDGASSSSASDSVAPHRELTREEVARLHELVIANKAMTSPIVDDERVRSGGDPSLINVINLTDIAIRRLIKMSKKISAFRVLCEEDQVALLKGGCTELMILRSVMTYNPENECWLGPQGPRVMRIKLDVLREAKGNVYEEHKRFIHSFEPGWRSDENVMLLLGAVTLFTPTRPHVRRADLIRREQDAYYRLLRHYLETVGSAVEARAIYRSLAQRIEELHILNENHVRVFLDVNPKDVEPLLIEIFDLKHHH